MYVFSKKHSTINIIVIAFIVIAVFLSLAVTSEAASTPVAYGKTNTKSVVLRKGPGTNTKKLKILKKNTKLTISQEVFTSKNNSKARYKWYRVKAGSKSGYIRSDLVKVTKYNARSAWTTDALNYRVGAGTGMKRKGTLKSNAKIAVFLPAKEKSGNKVWYKIKRGSSYYYVCADWLTFTAPKSTNPTPSSTKSSVAKTDTSATTAEKTSIPEQSAYAKSVADGACKWAVKIANDNSFHYGNGKHSHHNGCYYCGTQPSSKRKYVVQWQKTYCCNPFVTAAYAHGGKEPKMLSLCQNGKSWMAPQFKKSVRFLSLGHPKQSELKRGDILCVSNHVALYLGNGKIAEAASSDNGKPGSSSWNSSIRIANLTARRYAGFNAGVFRYIGTD